MALWSLVDRRWSIRGGGTLFSGRESPGAGCSWQLAEKMGLERRPTGTRGRPRMGPEMLRLSADRFVSMWTAVAGL